MAYANAKSAGTAAAAGIIAGAGFAVDYQDDHAGKRIAITDPGGRDWIFMDGFWDADGEAAADTLMAYIKDGGDYRRIPDDRGPIDWANAGDVAAAIFSALDCYGCYR